MTISSETVKKINADPKRYAEKISVTKLEKLLRELSIVYYNTGESQISDESYDMMKDVLEKRDPSNKYLKEIGAPPTEQEKVKLPYPMGSLEKIKREKDNLLKYIEKHRGPYVLSDKLDGVSAQLYKNNDGEVKLYKRGNGVYGKDISHLIKYVVPKTAQYNKMEKGDSYRGEIIINKKDFEKISDKMKNARNAASGVVNSKTIDEDVAKKCQLVTYSILNPRYRHSDQLKKMKEMGFKVVEYKVVDKINFEILDKYLLERRADNEFDIDGIVVVDDGQIYPHEEGNPEHAFAYKMNTEDQIAETTIKKIIWEISMDGYIKPRVEVEPVNVKGVTITHATAHNAQYVVENKLGAGAVIKIIRSGDVIPKILEVVKPANQPDMPTIPYRWNKTGVDIVVKDIYDDQGDKIKIKKITHFFKTLEVKNISEGIITKMVSHGYNSIPIILSAKPEDLMRIEGMGEKIIDKIYKNINTAMMNTNLYTMMAAMHMGRGLGRRKLKQIVDAYPNIMNEKWSKNETVEKIIKVDGFSDVMANVFAENFGKFKKEFEEINKIINISYLKNPENLDKDLNKDLNKHLDNSKDLEGKKFVFTGIRDKELEKQIEDRGGKISGSVSKTTTAVVTVDKTFTSSKIQEAKKHNVPILTVQEMMDRYLNHTHKR